MKNVDIYTDGACSGNPGAGGWACILIHASTKKELSGFEAQTTNNRMEMLSVINGLLALNQPCKVNIFSDSAYVVDAFNNNWIINWQSNNWKTASKTEVKNKELWLQLIELTKKHTVKWNKVKGHSDNELNNRCDELARAEIKRNS